MAIDVLSRLGEVPIVVGDDVDIADVIGVQVAPGGAFIVMSGEGGSALVPLSKQATLNMQTVEEVAIVGLTSRDAISGAALWRVNSHIRVRDLFEHELKAFAERLAAGDFNLDFLRDTNPEKVFLLSGLSTEFANTTDIALRKTPKGLFLSLGDTHGRGALVPVLPEHAARLGRTRYLVIVVSDGKSNAGSIFYFRLYQGAADRRIEAGSKMIEQLAQDLVVRHHNTKTASLQIIELPSNTIERPKARMLHNLSKETDDPKREGD